MKILIATDFSEAADNAARYGTDMALALNTDMLLLHVYQVPVPMSSFPIVPEEVIRSSAETNMKKLEEDLKRRSGNKIQIQTEIKMGIFFSELNTLCKKVMPLMVVLGSQGKTAAERLILGSEAVYTMQHLTWPVMAVPPGSLFSDIKKIGLACDFDHVTDSVKVEEIKRFVTIFNAELHVLNTGDQKDFDADILFESKMLMGMLKKIKPKYHLISNEDTDEGILTFAEKNKLDLLIVLPRRHSLIEKLFHKSHTKQFVLHSHLPVMALHLQPC